MPTGCSRSARNSASSAATALAGAVFDGVDANGTLVAGTKLLWPQTEYLKALVARAEFRDDAAARDAIPAHLALIAQSYMRPDGASWHNQLARDGTPLTPATPARVLYHLFLASPRWIGVICKPSSPSKRSEPPLPDTAPRTPSGNS